MNKMKILFLVFLMSFTGYAVSQNKLFFGGRVFENVGEVNVSVRNNGDVVIQTQNKIVLSEGENTPPPVVVNPTPPIQPQICSGSVANTSRVNFRGSIPWSQVPGVPQDRVSNLPRNQVAVYQFCTTPLTPRAGQIAIAAAPAESTIIKKMWISTVPDGPPIEASVGGPQPACQRQAGTTVTVNWEHRATPRSTRCTLQDNKVYYLNIEPIGCPKASCGYFLNHY